MRTLISLDAVVTSLTSGANQRDKKSRAMVTIVGAPVFSNELKVVNDCGLVLDQRVVVTISVENFELIESRVEQANIVGTVSKEVYDAAHPDAA